jgi:tetratricopeptide (TPR) repeat protein
VALFQSGRLTEALPHFESALKLKPDYTAARENLAEVKNNLGAGSFKDGKLEEARAQFQAAVDLNPGHPGAHNNLGVVLWRLARPGEALPHLREAVRLKPDYTEAQQALAALETQLSPTIPPIK